MPISQTLYNYKKINNIVLKLLHSLLRMPKIIEIGESCSPKNAIQKHNQLAYK